MGIQLGSQFDPNMALPLDSRDTVVDITARNAIASGLRYLGMLVYVESDETTYQLKSGITNSDWEEFGGSSTGAAIDITNKTWTATGTGVNPILIEAPAHGLKPGTFVRLYGDLSGTGQVHSVPDEDHFYFPAGSTLGDPLAGYYVSHDANVVHDRVSGEIKLAPPGDALMDHYQPQIIIGLAFNKTTPVGIHNTTKEDIYMYGPLNIPASSVVTISDGTTYNIL